MLSHSHSESPTTTMPPKKPRWKFPFSRTTTAAAAAAAPQPPNIPASFICTICSSLMSDPVVLPSGLTFDRSCIEACSLLNFTPPSLSSPLPPPPLLLIPNNNLRAAIHHLCQQANLPLPQPISPDSARQLVLSLILNNSSDSSSSSSTASFTSSSDGHDSPASTLEDEILTELKSPQSSLRESALVTLRSATRESAEHRLSLCTPRILAAVVPMMLVSSSRIRIHATAAIVNLSIESANKIRIVRAGAIPPLVHVLRCEEEEYEEACGNAAGALFSLALDDENKLAIGVLGGIPPLLEMFVGSGGNVEAGMALYHLSLAPNNLVKIAKVSGAMKALLRVASLREDGDGKRRRVALMVLASLARRDEGRVALMDADAVGVMVGMMRGKLVDGKVEEEEDEEYYCLGVMFEMSKGGMSSLRFRALARAAGAEEVLRLLLEKHWEGEGRVGRDMARKILNVIRGNKDREARKMMMMMLRDGEDGGEEDEEDDDEVASVVSDGLLTFRRRFDGLGSNSPSNSANF